MWAMCRTVTTLKELIRDAAPAWEKYQEARAAMDAAWEKVRSLANGVNGWEAGVRHRSDRQVHPAAGRGPGMGQPGPTRSPRPCGSTARPSVRPPPKRSVRAAGMCHRRWNAGSIPCDRRVTGGATQGCLSRPLLPRVTPATCKNERHKV
ncbi:hypothetical protein GCM10022630_19370 [Thermobifida alba]